MVRRKRGRLAGHPLLRLALEALIPAPLCLLGLTLLCLGRSALRGAGEQTAGPSPDTSVYEPLSETDSPEADDSSQGEASGTYWDDTVTLTVLVGEEEKTMTLGDYLWGVVAAEMPASFHQEALNAQAAAARTYTLYKMSHPSKAHASDVCTDSGCCQAWVSREDRLASWGEDKEELAAKITLAVRSTDGLGVCYEGEPILAVFHAASDGTTRSAQEVWGTEVAYLQSVVSPEGEEVPNYYSVVTVDPETFAQALEGLGCDLSGDPTDWIGPVHYDESGLSDQVTIGGVEVPTSTLRSLFSLRSASMTLEGSEEGVTFYVTGYGHGVGMSQYGANAMAEAGADWQEILTWYYSGATVEILADKLAFLE